MAATGSQLVLAGKGSLFVGKRLRLGRALLAIPAIPFGGGRLPSPAAALVDRSLEEVLDLPVYGPKLLAGPAAQLVPELSVDPKQEALAWCHLIA